MYFPSLRVTVRYIFNRHDFVLDEDLLRVIRWWLGRRARLLKFSTPTASDTNEKQVTD